MPLPEDVTTFTLTFGPYLDARGAAVLKDLKGSLTPISDSGRPIRILHPDSGSMIVPIDIPFVIGDDGTATIEDLPHTDNASLFPHPFRYKVTWGESARAMSGTIVKPSDKPFAVPISSGTSVDFDKQMEAVGQPGVQVTPQGVPPGGLTNYVMAKKSAADYDTKWMSLSGYVTDGQLDTTLEDYVTDDELADALVALDMGSYAKHTDVAAAINAIDFTPYALDTEVTAAIAAMDLTPYVTDDELAEALDVIGTSNNEVNEVVRRDSNGTVTLGAAYLAWDDVNGSSATRKSYVDAEIVSSATASRDRANHTGVQTTATIADLREYIEDTIGGMLRAVGADLNISYDDLSAELTIDYTGVTNDPESIRDAIGAAVVGLGNISVLVDDNADTITIVTSATVNSTDAALRDRSTHTGTQLASTISDLATAIDTAIGGRITAVEETLAAATNLATNDTLVKRSSTGGTAFTQITLSGTPAQAAHAARKDYVDAYGSLEPVAASTVGPGEVGYAASWFPSLRRYTLAGNITIGTLGTPASDRAGRVVLFFRQAATGGPYTVGWPASITWLTGGAPVMPTAASAVLRVELIWTGTEWLGVVPDGSTTATDAHSLVRRNASGDIDGRHVSASQGPVLAQHTTRKDYVDLYGSMRNIASGTLGAGYTLSASWLPSTRILTLGANLTINAMPTPPADRSGIITLVLKQPASGGPYTVTWPSGITWLTPIPIMPTAASATMRVDLIWTGTEWLGDASEVDLASATSLNNVNTIARRDNNGGFAVGWLSSGTTPSAATHVTRKDYVDSWGSSLYVEASTLSGAVTPGVDRPRNVIWTLSGNLALTIGAGVSGRTYMITITLKQAASGGPYTVTWPTLVWAGGAPAPTMPTVANAELIVQLLWNGSAWRGSVVGVFFP